MKKYLLPALIGITMAITGFAVANSMPCPCGSSCSCSPCNCNN